MNIFLTNSKPTFIHPPAFNINCTVKADTFKQEGELVYEYKPFRNIQDNKSGKLDDFTTSDLNFQLTSPVKIEVQPSYDGTVNLILNDDLNPPRLINSRFTVIEDKKFKIIDRTGDDDTNIYNKDTIDLETRLFKNSSTVPFVKFEGLQNGGNLQCGNYVFYFKYVDGDGNESDIICESFIIPVHDGDVNDPKSISGGILNTNCNKIIKLKLLNLDTSYDHINVYYTRSTGEDDIVKVLEYKKIIEKKILSSNEIELTISGFENTININKDLLNLEYNTVNRVKTQTQAQNILFFGNVDKPTIEYKELTDLSLRIIPSVSNDNNIGCLDNYYNPTDGNIENIEYYNMKNVYNYTGYWNNEIYRIGVVYILKDDSLTPVFNIRGCNNLGSGVLMNENIPLYTLQNNKKIREYISISEDGFLSNGTAPYENIKGVIRLKANNEIYNKVNKTIKPLGLSFKINDDVLLEIKKYAKGFFFVRQKRIPTILAQGLTIGVDKISNLPCLKDSKDFIMESFIDKDRTLTNNFDNHLLRSSDFGNNVDFNGILAPEIFLNKYTYSGLFNNTEFTLSNGFIDNNDSYLFNNYRSFGINNYISKLPLSNIYVKNKMIIVEDSSPLKTIGNSYFSAIAGIPEEAYRIKYFSKSDVRTDAINLIRGCFTSYIGCNNNLPPHKIINIHTPGYNENLMKEYFKVRINSFSTYYPISNRYDINKIDKLYSNIKINNDNKEFIEYRGDCYINTITVRMNRNFSDPEVPINNEIIDDKTWFKNYGIGTDPDKTPSDINRSDVNAVSLGHWVTFKICSTLNLALRSLDYSNSDEVALLGRPRGFYPIFEKSVQAESKMPETQLYNIGLSTTTSEKEYLESPDVPYLKNIFDNRIMFSQKHVNDSFQNGYRIFQGLQYQDITKQYGAIVKILEWYNNLIVVFENGISLLPINERALIQTESNQSVHMYGAGVLPEKESVISPDYGSRWEESIIKTPIGIYGIDTEAKKIWRYTNKGFEIISDLKIGKFLNDNLNFENSEHYSLIGVRNVKTHYDNFKGDVIFTCYNNLKGNDNYFNLIFNERIGKWITRTSWTPLSSENINNIFISYDKDRSYEIALNALTISDTNISNGVVLSNNEQTKETLNNLYKVGYITLKGYDYYDKYDKEYLFYDENNTLLNYQIINNYLYCPLLIESKIIKVIIKLSKDGINAPDFIDYIYIKPNGFIAFPDNNLYKHGKGMLFKSTENAKPTNWYNKQHPFEFEFIVNDNFYIQKIFNNLKIISNKVKPESIKIQIEGDGYNFENNGISNIQIIKDIKEFGRSRGNAHYKENIWDVEIKPFIHNNKEVRFRDKYIKIRVNYSGTDLAIITLLQTLYTFSYA